MRVFNRSYLFNVYRFDRKRLKNIVDISYNNKKMITVEFIYLR